MSKNFSHNQRSCPSCDSFSALQIGEKNNFRMLSCQNCHTWYVSHLPTSDNEQDYDKYYSPANLVTPDFISRRLDEIAATFTPHRQNNRLLDVGFGAGDLLRAAVRAGWDAEGIEVSLPAVEHACTLGLNARLGKLAEAKYPDSSFDVVTAVEVLEHVPDPQQIIDEVARILRPGGLFWATTPSGRGISARLLKMKWSVVSPPEHLQLLSPQGMRILLNNSGFASTSVATQGTNPYEIVHVFRSLRKANRTHSNSNAEKDIFHRNETGYQLNEALSSSPSRRILKNALNRFLNISHLGDSLKVRGVL